MACGKQFADGARLAQHLQDKHGGVNEPGAVSRTEQAQAGGSARPASLTLADMMVVRPKCAAHATAQYVRVFAIMCIGG